jgi:hypothetical protein
MNDRQYFKVIINNDDFLEFVDWSAENRVTREVIRVPVSPFVFEVECPDLNTAIHFKLRWQDEITAYNDYAASLWNVDSGGSQGYYLGPPPVQIPPGGSLATVIYHLNSQANALQVASTINASVNSR